MKKLDAENLLNSELWTELIELTGEFIYTEWSIATTIKERERLFSQLEGARVMDRVLRQQSNKGSLEGRIHIMPKDIAGALDEETR